MNICYFTSDVTELKMLLNLQYESLTVQNKLKELGDRQQFMSIVFEGFQLQMLSFIRQVST